MDTIFYLSAPDPLSSGRPPSARISPDAVTPAAVAHELQRILSSVHFSRARRSRALLRFIVLQMVEGNAAATTEQAIAIHVFARRASDYHPADDPIVRVQVGRLRRQLAAYYAGEGRTNPLRIAIPTGGYQPLAAPAHDTGPVAGFTFHPLACLSRDWAAQAFTQGLNDELRHRLHRAFGHGLRAAGAAPGPAPATRFVLEGSVRAHGAALRTALRLTNRSGAAGEIAWSEQVDHPPDWPTACQEALATSCCQVLLDVLRRTG